MSMSMLHVNVLAAFPCSCWMPMSLLHAPSMLHVRVFAACPCPCSMSVSKLWIQAEHAACLCCITILDVHAACGHDHEHEINIEIEQLKWTWKWKWIEKGKSTRTWIGHNHGHRSVMEKDIGILRKYVQSWHCTVFTNFCNVTSFHIITTSRNFL
jgi:hypothetical protein